MKSSLKTIAVCLDKDNTTEHVVDKDIFPDPFLEAVTRAVELGVNNKHILVNIRPIATCWEVKSPKKQYSYNSYLPIVNAGFHVKAELLREKFKAQYDIDLATQPIGGCSN